MSRIANDRSTADPQLGVFGTVFLITLGVFLLTATYSRPWNIDAVTNAITAWSIANTGSPILPNHVSATADEQIGNVAWIVPSPRGPVSQYPPGAALTAAPLYALLDGGEEAVTIRGTNRPHAPPVTLPLPSLAPAAVVAAVVSALAVGLTALSFWLEGGRDPVIRRSAIWGGIVAGVCTSQWNVSSNMLWQHGSSTAAIAAGVVLVYRRAYWSAGVAFGAALLVRPHTAVIAAILGVGLAISRRSLGPVVKIGLGTVIGLVLLLGYNYWIWGTVSVSGGYGGAFTEGLAQVNFGWYIRNILGAFLDPQRGLLIASPILIFVIPGLRQAWRTSTLETRWAAVGGVVYLLVQLKANRFSGGSGFYGYRYPLEALTAAAPLLMASYRAWMTDRARMSIYFKAAVVASAVPQAVWAIRV